MTQQISTNDGNLNKWWGFIGGMNAQAESR